MKKCFSLIIGIFLSISLNLAMGQVLITSPMPIIKDTIIHDEVFTYISDGGDLFIDEEGSPKLPLKHIRISLPQYADLTNISAVSCAVDELELSNKVMSSQPKIPISNSFTAKGRAIDTCTYSPATYFPTNILYNYRVIHWQDSSFLDVAIAPYQYDASHNKIFHHAKINLNYDYTIQPKKTSTSIRRPQTDIGLPFYEYVIITVDTLANAFDRFIQWKRAKGYNVGVVNISNILNNVYLTGDLVSQIYDDAGKLRQYLIYSYDAVGTKYALLGGDYNMVPIRYGATFVGDDAVPADMYFSDLTGEWDSNNNQVYGEFLEDGIDVVPEIFVGRLLCNSANEVANWTEKVLRYEINPGAGDCDYVSRALFTQSDQMQMNQQAEQIANMLPDIQCTILSETPSACDSFPSHPLGSEIIDSINSKHYGLLSNFNHGGPISYGTATFICKDTVVHNSNSVVVSMDVYDEHDEWLYSSKPEQGNGFDNLTNNLCPSIMYSVSCDNMPFDDYNTPNGTRNLGEVFTGISNGGGPAYLGNTRYGIVNYSIKLYKQFVTQVLSYNHIGVAEALSKMHLFPMSYNNLWCCYTHNVLGCPETPLWTEMPHQFSNVSVVIAGNSISISTTTNATDMTICVSGYINNVWRQFVSHNSNSLQIDTIPDDYSIVITKPNFIPYYHLEQDECLIQDKSIYNTEIHNSCNTILIGSEITPLRPHGDVIVQAGGNLIVTNHAEVIITGGFSVAQGGQLTIQ